MSRSNHEPGSEAGANEPVYLQAARRQARERGISVEEFLAEGRRAAASPPFPSVDCLYPEDAEWFLNVRFGLDPEAERPGFGNDEDKVRYDSLLDHLSDCDYCSTMLLVMERPAEVRREAFLEAVRAHSRSRSPVRRWFTVPRPARALWPAALPFILAVVLVAMSFAGPSVLGVSAKNVLPVALVVVAIVFGVFVAISRLSGGLPKSIPAKMVLFTRLSYGLAIPAMIGIVFFSYLEWRSVGESYQVSQDALVAALKTSYSKRISTATFPWLVEQLEGVVVTTTLHDDSHAVYAAQAASLPGRMIAVAKQDGGEIKWAVGNTERTKFDIKVGTIEPAGNNKYWLVTQEGERIATELGGAKHDDPAGKAGFALIPTPRSLASAFTATLVYPIEASANPKR